MEFLKQQAMQLLCQDSPLCFQAVCKLHLVDGKQEIDIREHKDWINISMIHAQTKDFGGSHDLTGSFPIGQWVGRDGVIVHEDMSPFGVDWQVQVGVGKALPEVFPLPWQM